MLIIPYIFGFVKSELYNYRDTLTIFLCFLEKFIEILNRSVAGSAYGSGHEGRRFKSRRLDQKPVKIVYFHGFFIAYFCLFF